MPEIEKHLHQLSHLIRKQDSIKLVVRLESAVGSRIRYLAVVSCIEQETEEYCLLGIDCDNSISLGLVLAILSFTTIRLDGDGGFCVTSGDDLRSHIFKPVSVQTMWSALQSLYRASECAKENNSFQACAVQYYENVLSNHKSDPSCLTEWNILPGVEYRRPLASAFTSEELSFQEKISYTLREILLCERDLDEVTSKEIRTKLEYKLQTDLSTYKSFIDEEMLKILGQMEAPALIVDHLYLGTEWNASHQQDLFDKQINHILNVTTEIDNFFPDTFRYMNIPVCDTEETDILRYFNDSYRFINKARKDGENVLVHCKMGISRSATIVIAYVMKARNWDLNRSLKHVKERRTCVKPNPNFMKQLEVYEGILTAKRYSSTLEKRSKSESNLKQSDKASLSMHDDKIMCSSNSDITDGRIEGKSQKKYFHTAPARLKPENGRLVADILRPKSSSCAAIAIQVDQNSLHDIVPQDIMNSFKAAVSSLEQQSTIPSPPEKLFSAQEPSMASIQNPIVNLEIPVVMVTNEEPEPCSFTATEELLLQSSASEEQVSTFEPPQAITITSDSAISVSLPILPLEEILENVQPDPSESQVSDECKQVMSLKCCRRPYNGHTFSVSPNQVVNITSFVDYSKCSVRHLVNEFELHSNRLNQGSASGGESATNSLELTLHTPVRASNRGIVRKHLDRGDTDYSSEENQEVETIPIHRTDEVSSPVTTGRSSKKSEKLGSGCLPFFRKLSSSGSKSSLSKNAVAPGTGQSSKKQSFERSREKPKEKGMKCNRKVQETVARLSENGDSIAPLEHIPVKYQSTGVVKQRLEAFEAKAVPNSKHQFIFRSHNRSHSATGASSSLQYETLGLGHFSHRKSSMPQLRVPSSEFESSPPLSHRLPLSQVSDRKASLDSNSLFRSFPCVRGFQNSGSKSFFSTSPNSSTRQQHGSTHPLNLLPRTPTLT